MAEEKVDERTEHEKKVEELLDDIRWKFGCLLAMLIFPMIVACLCAVFASMK